MKKRSIFLFACALASAGTVFADEPKPRPASPSTTAAPWMVQPTAAETPSARFSGVAPYVPRSPALAGSGLQLSMTLAPDDGDPNQCGTATSLTVADGDRINLCYTVTNHTGVATYTHTLSDTLSDPLFDDLVFYNMSRPLVDGESFQYNRIVYAALSQSGPVAARWDTTSVLSSYGYDDTGPSNFVDITAIGTPLDLGVRESANVAMPFTFNFYGDFVSQLAVDNSGSVTVDAPGATCSLPLMQIPVTCDDGQVLAALFPLGDVFDGPAPATGGVYYATLGTAPNRRFIVEWTNRVRASAEAPNPNVDGATFEIVFYEASGKFSFEYQDVDYTGIGDFDGGGDLDCDGGNCAVIGVQQGIDDYTRYAFRTNSVHAGQSIAWTYTPPLPTYIATAAATLTVEAAGIAAEQSSLSATAGSGGSATATLNLHSTGSRELAWEVDEGSSRSAARAQESTGAAAAVPAYGFFDSVVPYDPNADVALNASDPSASMNLYHPQLSNTAFFYSAAIAGNDFSKQYAISPYTYDSYGRPMGLSVMDTLSGVLTPINQDLGGVSGLRWDPSSETMYAFGFLSELTYVFSIDLATGAATEVAQVPIHLLSVAFDNDGRLYGLGPYLVEDPGGASHVGKVLVEIDLQAVEWRIVREYPDDAGGYVELQFDPSTNLLYYTRSLGGDVGAEMFVIDPADGAVTDLGPVRGPDGQAGDFWLFTIAVPSGACARPQDEPWLSVSPANGTTAAGGDAALTVSFDASTLGPGTYRANLCVHSNVRSNRLFAVPVEFVVNAADSIFVDGFDGAVP